MPSATPTAGQPRRATAPTNIVATTHTTACIVGGGPGGVMLAYLLARRGVRTTLLEAHHDFDRDFRGDTIHPGVMEILDDLGLAKSLLQLPHTEARTIAVPGMGGPFQAVNFGRVAKRFPYITILHQAKFLDFMANEAKRFPNFELVLGAHVEDLIWEHGAVRGARYRSADGWHEVRALLTVGADGRGSRVRRLAGQEPIKTSPPMDILWFKLPRRPGDTDQTFGGSGPGVIVACINRIDYWQVGYVIPKDHYRDIRAAGLDHLRQSVASIVPMFADRVDTLTDWRQASLLSVESSRVRRWWLPGLLLIGDAAHVMSPVGGVGINYAIQDAIVAANILADSLKASRLRVHDLRRVQRAREWPTRVIQFIQTQIQRRVLAGALASDRPLQIPPIAQRLLQLPLIGDIPPRIVGYGVWPVRAKL